MSAASAPFGVKQWLAQHALRKVPAPALTFDDHTRNVAWAQLDWPYHLGLYGPETQLSALQHRLATQLLALDVPVLLIGTSADAQHPTGLLHGDHVPRGAHPLILSPHAPDDVAATPRLHLTPTRPERPLQAALIFSASLPLPFTTRLTKLLASHGISGIFAVPSDHASPHAPGLLFHHPYHSALIWPAHAQPYEALTTQPLPNVRAGEFLFLRRRHHPQTFSAPVPPQPEAGS